LAQLDALHRRHAQACELTFWPFGVVASAVANFSMYPPRKPLQPVDFGLGPKPRSLPASSSAAAVEQQESLLRAAFRALRGAVPAPRAAVADLEISHAE